VLPLIVEHITKSYGRRVVLKDLSFTVHPGKVTGFLGPNGAGKSTTMKILLDLASADEGRASIGGTRYRDLAEPARMVGVVLEPNAFHPGRTGRNHLRVLADGAGFPMRRVDEVLELTGLADAGNRKVGAYSLGMRQRLSLAGAVLGDPPILVLDEPGNGLDPQGIHDLRDVLRDRATRGDTVFVSSHLLSEVEHLADEVVVLHHGRLVTTGALSELQHAGVTVRTPRADELARRLIDSGARVDRREGDVMRVRHLSIEDVGEISARAGIALHELSPQAGSLEDLFLSWTSDAVQVEVAAQVTHTTGREVAQR
jgi:ABC-2 type transport system ATP-binding protein